LGAYVDMPLQFVTACETQRLRGLRMAEKTMVEKAGEAVGFGIAMAEDVAGAVKTAVGAAVATVFKKASATKAPVTQVAKKVPAKKVKKAVRKAVKKAPATKAIKKSLTKMAGKKSTAKKAAKKSQPRRRRLRKP
jgi:hypothetical protein